MNSAIHDDGAKAKRAQDARLRLRLWKLCFDFFEHPAGNRFRRIGGCTQNYFVIWIRHIRMAL
jgi:hypothetical protein